MIKTYDVKMTAKIKSNLSEKDLINYLVFCLFDIETNKTILDGESNKLEVIEYNDTVINLIEEE